MMNDVNKGKQSEHFYTPRNEQLLQFLWEHRASGVYRKIVAKVTEPMPELTLLAAEANRK